MNKEYIILGVLALIIFFLDIAMPLGVAGGVPYVLLIIRGWRLETPMEIIALGAITILLIGLGFMLSPSHVELWIVFINRLYAIIAVTVMVFAFYRIKEKKVSMTEEIDNKNSALKDLQISENKLQSAFDNLPVGHIQINDKGLIETFNPAAQKIFNYTPEEIIGKNVSTLMPHDIAKSHDDYIHRHLETGEGNIIGFGREVIGVRKNGETFPLHLGVSKLTINNEAKFIGSIVDLSTANDAPHTKVFI